jgi:hypothetical protein
MRTPVCLRTRVLGDVGSAHVNVVYLGRIPDHRQGEKVSWIGDYWQSYRMAYVANVFSGEDWEVAFT